MGLAHTVRTPPAAGIPPRDLAAKLSRRVRGEVRFDPGTLALYATDLSVYRQVPIGVVVPRGAEDVIAALEVCRRDGVPILGRGCGTSLAGQCCNTAVVIDFSKYMHRVLELDPDGRTAWVEPGLICDDLRDAAEAHHLTFGPDPATHAYCTLGGMIGNNSCGVHTVMAGKTDDNVEELEILTYDGTVMRVGATPPAELDRTLQSGGRRGEVYRRLAALRDRYADEIRRRFPRIPRRVSGYNLDHLLPEQGFHVARALVGSESTLALVLRARVRLVPSPAHRALVLIGYREVAVAGDHVPAIRRLRPIGLEAFHVHVIENMQRKGKEMPGRRLLPEGDTWLLVEFGGDHADEAAGRAHDAMAALQREGRDESGMRVLTDPKEQAEVWEIREAGVGSSRVPGVEDAWPGWEDGAVAPERLGDYLRGITALLSRFGYAYTLFGHFGDGCVHTRIAFDLKTPHGVRQFRAFMEQAADLVVSLGGSISGEHGDGQARAELLPKMFGPEIMQAFREFKAIWDPDGRMNPGKVVDPYPLDSNLRAGPDYRPRPVATHFRFHEDGGSFAAATERCFGVGKCRRLSGGTMCPSFMATREERHSTRGRAHLLFEMLRGEVITDGWKSEEVKEALDLCLACKGCKGDCPVSVDIATYKAEFLSHYYAGRRRPRTAYAMGLVFEWARLASWAPGLVNALGATPVVGPFLKAAAGIAPARTLPAFAGETFQTWWRRRARRRGRDGAADDGSGGARGEGAVVLWPDTFTNYFHPRVGRAAVEVLERLGYEVVVPAAPVCCGRPLYDYGMLDRAKRQLTGALDVLRPYVRRGVPVIGLEPSCLAVFRDELLNLLPDDDDARRLAGQAFAFSEFLLRQHRADGLPRLSGRALLHVHCHQKALIAGDPDRALLEALGLSVETPDPGCCGMAGSFGFEHDHHDLSMRIGERALLPAVRRAAPDTVVVADGFSCRTQIEQGASRRPRHVAEILQLAFEAGGGRSARLSACAERESSEDAASLGHREVAAAAVLALGAWLLGRVLRRPRPPAGP